jgi:hypothetical protein
MADTYPSDWDSRRKAIYRRDDFTCQNCGREGGSGGNAELHAHHIVPKSKGGSHSASNLVAMCKQCHDAIHGNTYAPTTAGAVPNQSNQEGYFSEVATLIGNATDFAEPAARYLPLVEYLIEEDIDDASRMVNLERRIKNRSIKQKAELASYNVGAAPDHVHEGFVEAISLLFNARIDLAVDTQGLIEEVQEHRGLFLQADQHECPDCGEGVETADAFCGSCGADLSDVGVCPDCQSELPAEDDFCRECGAVVGDTGTAEEKDELADEMKQKMRGIEDSARQVTTRTQVIMAHTGAVANPQRTEHINWECCPNCGFERSVFQNNEAECVICGARWSSSGILSKNWEMVEGDQRGETHSDSGWAELGEQKHQAEVYEEYVHGDRVTSTEIDQRVSKFSN